MPLARRRLPFRSFPATIIICPICGERFVGGANEHLTAQWIALHEHWHGGEQHSEPPPPYLVAFYMNHAVPHTPWATDESADEGQP